MGFTQAGRRRGATGFVVVAVAAVLLAIVGVGSVQAGERAGNVYTVHNLVSDVPGAADHADPNLVNGWGLTCLPGSPWWVADNGTNVSTIYTGSGIAARSSSASLAARRERSPTRRRTSS
jgi:hypothetical protein